MDTILTLEQVRQVLLDRVDAVDRKVDQTRVQLEEKIDAVDRKVDQSRVQLEEKIDAVDRKVDQTRVQLEEKIDAVDRKVDQTRDGLTNLITATAIALEHGIDKKLDQKLELMEGRLLKATDSAVERVIGTVFERARYDAAVLDDKIKGLERTMNQHISNERIHLSPEDRRR